MTKFTTTVLGRQNEWRVEVSEASVDDMRADGIEVLEISNTIPAWAVDASIGQLWMFAQDVWDAPSRIWRKIRRNP
jgi:hypothetical protein